MPKKGGQTTFSGTKYQAEITALYLGRLLDSRPRGDNEMVIEVRPECDAEADVDDILVRFKDGHTEWFQVKENIENSGETWIKMWKHFESQLSHMLHVGDRIEFILGNPQTWSRDLREICERAESAKDSQEWLKIGNLSRKQHQLVDSLKNILGKTRSEDLFDLMSHIHLRVYEANRVRVDLGPNWMPESNYKPLDLYDKILRIVFDAAEKGNPIYQEWLLEKLSNEQIHIHTSDSALEIVPKKVSHQILFDENHGQRVWYPVKPTMDEQFQAIAKLASERCQVGYVADGKHMGKEDINQSKLFILPIGPRGMTMLSSQELDLFHNFVRDPGHCLLVMSTYDGDAHHKANLNELLHQEYGIQFQYDVILPEASTKDDAYAQAGHYDVDSRHAFCAYPTMDGLPLGIDNFWKTIMKDVKVIRSLSSCSIAVKPQRGAFKLITSDPKCKIYEQESPSWGFRSEYKDDYQSSATLMAASKEGRVIALGGWKMFTDEFIEDHRYDNKQLFLNILDWVVSN